MTVERLREELARMPPGDEVRVEMSRAAMRFTGRVEAVVHREEVDTVVLEARP